jgi:predicted nucleic acid-binding protein
MVDLLLAESLGTAVIERIDGVVLHAPAHIDAEVISGLGRLHRAGRLPATTVARQLDELVAAPVQRHPLPALVLGAWKRRDRVQLADAFYVELATTLGVRLVTTDTRLGRASRVADVVTV